MPECPQDSELTDYISGQTQESQTRTIADHLDQCPSCHQRVEDMRKDEGLLTELREATGHHQVDYSIHERLQQVTSDYEILDPIGQGGCGVVFKARDVHLDRLVAIKCPTTPDQHRRLVALFDEARVMARINHPNVTAIHVLSEETDPPYLVMEFLDAIPITAALINQPSGQKISVFRQVLSGVAELHRRGVVHCDLKPSNILVDRKGTAKVLDMGIAEQFGSTRPALSNAPSARGTPAYMAPEQTLGLQPHPPADVFSLGIILFELITGHRPFSGEDAREVIQAIRYSNPALPRSLQAGIPGPLQAICLAALEKNPGRRYPDARHFLQDIERFCNGEAVTADPTILSDILEHGVDKHIDDVHLWQKDRLISTREHDYFIDKYDRLLQREEFWVLDSRRISFSQVVLHLGVWACVVSSFLMLRFKWSDLAKWERVLIPSLAFSVLLVLGSVLWRHGTKRVAIVLLIGASLVCPLLIGTMLVTMELCQTIISGKDLLPGLANNAQFLLATGTWAALSLALWKRTGTSAFSLVTTVSVLALSTACFAMLDMIGEITRGNADTVAGWYLIPGSLMLFTALYLDLRGRAVHHAGPPYVIGIAVLLAAMTIIALLGPTTEWIGLVDLEPRSAARVRHVKYAFVINGIVYLLIGLFADRSKLSRWLRQIATFVFWLAPSHILVAILLLENEWAVLPGNWTVAELLLPFGALFFIFISVPKQMKSFFFSGLFYMAVSVQRLTDRHFEHTFAWPIALATGGFLLALAAWRYPALFDRSKRRIARRRG